MCIKIYDEEREFSYNANLPLEQQVSGNERIVINFDPADDDIGKFVKEIQRCVKSGICQQLHVDVVHNSNIMGMKTKSTVKKAIKDLTINDLIKYIVSSYHNADQKLEEISKHCSGGICE